MKLEITKEFSTTYLTERYYVLINGITDKSFASFEDALERLTEIKIAASKSKPAEVLYTEDF